MTKMLIDIDEEVLTEAAALLGTGTKKETVNTALAETVRRLRRAKSLVELAERGKSGQFNDLLDKSTYRR